jgi:integrase
LVALTWSDIDLELMLVNVRRSCVRNRCGDTKTEASRKPVPLHPSVAKMLAAWREESLYPADNDFVFASLRLHETGAAGHGVEEGDSARARKSRHHGEGHRLVQLPPLARGQPSRRRGRPTTAQELFRHANLRITLEVYTRAISSTKREANDRVMQMFLEAGKKTISAPSPIPSRTSARLLEVGDFREEVQMKGT